MSENPGQASLYAEKIAKMLFTAPDGREANLLIQADYTNGSPANPALEQLSFMRHEDFVGTMRWDYVVQNIRRILEA